jgi:dynein light intermediate chain 1
LFYTAPTQPDTYSTLVQYLLHQLYTTPPPLNPTSDAPPPAVTTRFPFPYRANVLDRDALRIPAGWDSWGKISVLREGFDPARVGRAWDVSLARLKEPNEEGEGVEELWEASIPITDRGPKVSPSACDPQS